MMRAATQDQVKARLEGKIAVIFGAGGDVGAAVAKEFAAEGARLFLSGRTESRVQAVADAISADGRTAAAAELDALDEDAVNRHIDQAVATAGRVDIVFNAMGPQPTSTATRRAPWTCPSRSSCCLSAGSWRHSSSQPVLRRGTWCEKDPASSSSSALPCHEESRRIHRPSAPPMARWTL